MEDTNDAKFLTFEDFWWFYLRQHAQPETRALHIAGTTVAALGLGAFLATRKTRYLGVALLGSYGPAWFGHATYEHNKPATFEYPLWSLRADLLMYKKWLTGQLEEDLKRAQLMRRAIEA